MADWDAPSTVKSPKPMEFKGQYVAMMVWGLDCPCIKLHHYEYSKQTDESDKSVTTEKLGLGSG